MGEGRYNTKGMYNKYDKKHRERDSLDYYATPPDETYNALEMIGIKFQDDDVILEPACGGGHMARGIYQYLIDTKSEAKVVATDIHEHPQVFMYEHFTGEEYDFLGDDYDCGGKVDYVIMNPPYSTIEPFTIRALEIAEKGVLMLGRLQFLEGVGRYENVFMTSPPTDVYIYVDRIQCWKGGVKPAGSSSQAYAWFYWDLTGSNPEGAPPQIHWIRRK